MLKFRFDVRINGRSISSPLAPILEEISTFDGTDNEADTASITLSDIGGSILMADERDPVEIDLGREDEFGLVFQGYVSDIRSKGSRSGGRTLTMECRSVDPGGKAKEPLERHWDDQTLGKILKDAFAGTGMEVMISPKLASIVRDYEAADTETPLAFARRLAEEVGATVKAMGSRFVFVERGAGLDVQGIELPVFEARVGSNVLDWDLTPIIPKSRYADTRSRWYDFRKGDWQEESEDISTGEARQIIAALKPNAGLAKQSALANKVASERDGGRGSITVVGSFHPQADGKCRVIGARDGIDGVYVINSVQHTASRSKGFVTKLELRKPEGTAGRDSRVPVPAPRPSNVPVPTPRPTA